MKTPSNAAKTCGKETTPKLLDGSSCQVTSGVHEGKSGTVRDINTAKPGMSPSQ